MWLVLGKGWGDEGSHGAVHPASIPRSSFQQSPRRVSPVFRSMYASTQVTRSPSVRASHCHRNVSGDCTRGLQSWAHDAGRPFVLISEITPFPPTLTYVRVTHSVSAAPVASAVHATLDRKSSNAQRYSGKSPLFNDMRRSWTSFKGGVFGSFAFSARFTARSSPPFSYASNHCSNPCR